MIFRNATLSCPWLTSCLCKRCCNQQNATSDSEESSAGRSCDDDDDGAFDGGAGVCDDNYLSGGNWLVSALQAPKNFRKYKLLGAAHHQSNATPRHKSFSGTAFGNISPRPSTWSSVLVTHDLNAHFSSQPFPIQHNNSGCRETHHLANL